MHALDGSFVLVETSDPVYILIYLVDFAVTFLELVFSL
jgi:hypothetical protein